MVALFLLLMLTGCSDTSQDRAKAQDGPKKKTAPVTLGYSEKKTIPVELHAVGTVEPFATVAIKSQITGTLKSIHFKEGEDVKKGALLFTIDQRPFTALLNQAQGALAKDRAELDNARKELERYTHAVKKGYVSTEQADQAATRVATLTATIQADEAAVENARLQLEFCSILSPIDGRTGEIPVAEGNLIKANADTEMVTINQISPIKVSFVMPGRFLGEIQRYRQAGSLQVLLPGIENNALTGRFSFIDNRVDPTTGTILLKAELANEDKRLWPGLFVDVRLILTTRPDVVVVPTQAIQVGQDGAHVFVVRDDMTVEDRQIVTGTIADGETVVEAGLQPGERVVTDGQLQLQNGTRVEERAGPMAAIDAKTAESEQKQIRGTP